MNNKLKISAVFLTSFTVFTSAKAEVNDLMVLSPKETRASITFRVPKADLNNLLKNKKVRTLNWNVDDTANVLMKSYGVKSDNNSKVKIHEEATFVDLSCFNCVIRSLDRRPDNLSIGF